MYVHCCKLVLKKLKFIFNFLFNFKFFNFNFYFLEAKAPLQIASVSESVSLWSKSFNITKYLNTSYTMLGTT